MLDACKEMSIQFDIVSYHWLLHTRRNNKKKSWHHRFFGHALYCQCQKEEKTGIQYTKLLAWVPNPYSHIIHLKFSFFFLLHFHRTNDQLPDRTNVVLLFFWFTRRNSCSEAHHNLSTFWFVIILYLHFGVWNVDKRLWMGWDKILFK